MVDKPSADPKNTPPPLGERLLMVGVYCLFALFALLPLSWLRRIGAFLGGCYYKLGKRRVHIVRTNLKIAYPNLSDTDRERLVKQALEAVGMWCFESVAIWMWPTKKILSYLEVANEALFFEAINQGKGLLLAMPHIGNWEVMGPYTTQHTEFACFYQHGRESPVINEFVRRRRVRNGTIMAPANLIGIRRLYKHLRAGKVAGILPDHFPTDANRAYAPFFGRLALTSTLASELARKNNAKVIATAVIRTKQGFTLHFIDVEDQHSEDPLKAATGINKAVERCIALAPEQFQWIYPRFRHRENRDDPNPYRRID